MPRCIINTTGTLDPVIFEDLGYITFYTATTLNHDLTNNFTLDEIVQSQSVQSAITAGYITMVDENNNFIFSSQTINIPAFIAGTNMSITNSIYRPTFSLSASPIVNNFTATGTSQFNSLSSTTISATTYVSDSLSGIASSAQTIDWSLSTNFDYSITANTQFTFDNSKNGSQIFVAVTNDTTTTNLTATWSATTATIYWSDSVAPTQSSNTGRTDIYSFIRVNNKIYGTYGQNYY